MFDAAAFSVFEAENLMSFFRHIGIELLHFQRELEFRTARHPEG